MKKQGIPNKWDKVSKNLYTSFNDYLNKNNITKVVIAVQKNIGSVVLAKLIKPICEINNVEILYYSVLSNEEKLPSEILDLFGENIYVLSEEEINFFSNNFSVSEATEIKFSVIRNQIKHSNEKIVFISDITKTEEILNLRSVNFFDFCPFRDLWGSELFELAEYLNIPESYIQSFPHTELDNIFDLRSKEDYKGADKILQDYFELELVKGLPKIDNNYVDKVKKYKETPIIKRYLHARSLKLLQGCFSRDSIFKYGEDGTVDED